VQCACRQRRVGIGWKLPARDGAAHQRLVPRQAAAPDALLARRTARELADELALVQDYVEHRLRPTVGREMREGRDAHRSQGPERIVGRLGAAFARHRVER
jgi:hypothetical protein